MHDCPGCQVPLHGHEAFCPVCGRKQNIRPEFAGAPPEKYYKGNNPLGFILIFLLIAGIIIYAVQSSWIGQLIRRGPDLPTGDIALSAPAAREKLENSILQTLNGQSKVCKFVYIAEGKTVDRNYPQNVELTIEVNLKNPSIRKSIVEPVKGLMEPGKINTLVLNDSRSHATITYTVAAESETNDEPKNPSAEATDQTNNQENSDSSNNNQ